MLSRVPDVAFVEQPNVGKLGVEEQLVADYLRQINVDIRFISLKKFLRNQTPLPPNSAVIGTIPFIKAGLSKYGKSLPPVNDYPLALTSFLHRKIWHSNLDAVRYNAYEGNGPVFVKPADQLKRFVGRVVVNHNDLYSLHGISKHLKVYCSEVVKWLSEHRAYVVRGEVRYIGQYDGDPNVAIDRTVIHDAVKTYQESGLAPIGYAIDFGVLSTGQTALVEVNDGFSVGAYGIDAETYSEMTILRWFEMSGQ